jgi:hypothetical protein
MLPHICNKFSDGYEQERKSRQSVTKGEVQTPGLGAKSPDQHHRGNPEQVLTIAKAKEVRRGIFEGQKDQEERPHG